MYRAFKDFEEDKECGVAVLAGRGGNFCAGYDLKELAGTPVSDILGTFGLGPSPMVNLSVKNIITNKSYVCRVQLILVSVNQ